MSKDKKAGGKRTIACGGGGSAKRNAKHLAGSSLATASGPRSNAVRQFVPVRGYVEATSPAAPQPTTPDTPTAQTRKLFWDALDEIWAEVPDEELRKIPADLAAQHDHYLYGLPLETVSAAPSKRQNAAL